MGRNRLASLSEVAPELADALAAFDRVRSYGEDNLSPNERVILALGYELLRVRAVCRDRDPQAREP